MADLGGAGNPAAEGSGIFERFAIRCILLLAAARQSKAGRMRVITELKTRGVHGSVIEKAVDAAYEGVSDEKQAREFLRKKRLEKPKDQKQAARIFRQLARAGFGMKISSPS